MSADLLSDPIPVAVLGFSERERQTLLSYLQAPGRWPHRYRHVLSLEEARFVVADGDVAAAPALLLKLGRVADAVFVGADAPEGAAAWLMRPLTPDQVLRELDEQQRLRENPDSAPLPLGLPSPRASGLGLLDLPPVASASPGVGRRQDDRRRGPVAAPPPQAVRAPNHSSRPLVAPRLLVVDDSEIALHFLRRLLRPYGVPVDMARFAHQALELLATRVYGLVFLDVDLGDGSGDDGLKLCRRLRQQFRHPGPRAPMVVMVSASHGPVDQVRGTLAGAEAFLGKPLDPVALQHLMARLGFRAARPAPAAGRVAPSMAEGLVSAASASVAGPAEPVGAAEPSSAGVAGFTRGSARQP